MLQPILDWLHDHGTLLWILGIASAVIFIASLFLIPAVVANIPADYFAQEKRPKGLWDDRGAPLRIMIRIGKNILGIVLLVAGIAMLALPGQGLMTMAVGFFLLDFPGKYEVEKWLVAKSAVRRPIDWLRRRAGKEPLKIIDAPP